MKKKKLTPRQRLFVAEYLRILNATQSAIKAGYSKKTAGVIAEQNLRKLEIIEALAQARNSIEKREETSLMGAHETDKLLDIVMRANPQDYFDEYGNFKKINELTRDQAYAISELSHIETPLGTQQKIKWKDVLSAIDKKMKRLGLFIEKQETKVIGEITIIVKGRR